jgi:serine/threonine protein kinase
LAPEIVTGKAYSIGVDWWAVGILLYEMLYGRTPFCCESRQKLFKRIAQAEVPFPSETEKTAQALVIGLLEKDPTKRFGYEQLRKHDFFEGLDFEDVLDKKVKPGFVPPESNLDFPGYNEGILASDQLGGSFDCPVVGSAASLKGFSFDVHEAELNGALKMVP